MGANNHDTRLLWLKAQAAVLGLPQYQLAKAVDMSPCRVSLLFNGQLPVDDEELKRMSTYLADQRAKKGLPEVRMVEDHILDEFELDARAKSPSSIQVTVGAFNQYLNIDDAQLYADLILNAIYDAKIGRCS